ncbi:hypothetical protein [Chryseobacterium jejuense]|uniref:hypothetical protein n=1 Tax=Chryseobacterium jejuense TaxID=445960 RepID=UPI001AE561DB|nr:hypothetical protein [Chryseobacterium jejuense]MBP2616745.1 hypothetical protein [Chryseobacterium jejuense]
MKKFLLIFSIIGIVFLKGQIGIGVSSPNTKSILDIESKNKGVLFPLINNVTRNSMNLGNSESSMWIMNTDTKRVNFWNGEQWKTFQSIKSAVFTINCSTVRDFSFLNVNQPASGYIQITLNVTEPGSVSLQTGTQNGIRFIGAQSVNSGNVEFTLEAVGTPSASGNSNFTLTNGGTSCTFPVTIH